METNWNPPNGNGSWRIYVTDNFGAHESDLLLQSAANGYPTGQMEWTGSGSLKIDALSASSPVYTDANSVLTTTPPATVSLPDSVVGIGVVTPTGSLQVATSTSNATTTVVIGKTGQNKGSCLELFNSAGNPVYAYVAAGASTFTLSATSCQ